MAWDIVFGASLHSPSEKLTGRRPPSRKFRVKYDVVSLELRVSADLRAVSMNWREVSLWKSFNYLSGYQDNDTMFNMG